MRTVYLVASGDSRPEANKTCEATQAAMEKALSKACELQGAAIRRAHEYDPQKGHGFIDSQRRGIEVFRSIPNDASIIVAEAVWQYSHHVLPGLLTHSGPILTVANWSGTWPGLVGLLNLNACLAKAGVPYSTLWSEDFADDFFLGGLREWLEHGRLFHDASHVHRLEEIDVPASDARTGAEFARGFARQKAILGVFDEACMGMYNAIVPDELLFPLGIFKERLSQSALYAKMLTVSDVEAEGVLDWLLAKGMSFRLGEDDESELTLAQVIQQCKMYIAAVRMAAEFGCDSIGIQYQQGLKDLVAASDLAEGLLNNVDRPPVCDEKTGAELYAGEAIPHFNEVDECAGVDALLTYRLWRGLNLPPESTLHDLRWGRRFVGAGLDAFVWVLEISGAVPPAHLEGGFRGAVSERQPAMYFPNGGGTIKGVAKPGHVVWSRIFVEGGKLNCDIGLADAVRLPSAETAERWRLTTEQWPIMHLVLRGITRDQMMSRHRSNHIQVAYAPDAAAAERALFAKAVALKELGLQVFVCGEL